MIRFKLAGLLLIGVFTAVAVGQESLRRSYNDGGYKAGQEGRYAEAEKLFRTAIREAETANVQDATLAISLNGLAGSLQDQGKYADAEPIYKRALQLHEQLSGVESTGVAATLQDLAAPYKAQGKYAEAEPLYKR